MKRQAKISLYFALHLGSALVFQIKLVNTSTAKCTWPEVLANELPREDFHFNRWRCIFHPDRAAPG